jgi:mono/diheme cytochrome c family protein
MKKLPLSIQILVVLLIAILVAQPSLALSEKESEQAGANLFRDKGCAYCHGTNAQGTQKGPSLANVRKKLKAPEIASQIQNGGQKMPSFSDSLTNDEVAQLVAYLRAKHRPVVTPAQVPAPVSNPAQ